MTVPDYESIMLPLLRILADGQEHTHAEVVESLAFHCKLSDEDKTELLPSGQPKFYNRVGWARTYLKKAGLLEYAGRGKYLITRRGSDVLTRKPTAIDVGFLRQFAEFRAFVGGTRQDNESHIERGVDLPLTPEETLEFSYQGLRRVLTQELLERIRQCSPQFFERLVVDLLVAMGYGGSRRDAGQAVGQSGDGGIDGIIKEDKLGLDVVYVQAKRWDNVVGRPVVQGFAGSLEGQRARKGVLITTSQFSQDAKDYVTRIEKKIVLIDGQQLAQLMIDHAVGVAEVSTYSVRKVDVDYFVEE